jgi:hypothetical protein
MLKRACAALAAFFMLSAGAHAAGTVPGFSLTPQFDQGWPRSAWAASSTSSKLARRRAPQNCLSGYWANDRCSPNPYNVRRLWSPAAMVCR